MFAALALAVLVAAAPLPAPRPGEPIEEQIRQNSLVGQFAEPPDPGRHPAVIVLGGINGGIPHEALSFALLGYASFGVAYFGAPPLPNAVDGIPVETVSRAVDYLVARPDVDPARIGIVGLSTGGELALLAAARDSRIKTVAVISPSAYVWFATAFDGRPDRSSWTANNGPLPFIPPAQRGLDALSRAYDSNGTFAFRELYDASLAAATGDAIAGATIPVERIAGPILCLAGDDDREWDSAAACRTIAARRRDAQRGARDEVAIERGAGHALSLGSPTPDVIPAGRMRFVLGGSPDANARAAADEWVKTVTFLAKTL